MGCTPSNAKQVHTNNRSTSYEAPAESNPGPEPQTEKVHDEPVQAQEEESKEKPENPAVVAAAPVPVPTPTPAPAVTQATSNSSTTPEKAEEVEEKMSGSTPIDPHESAYGAYYSTFEEAEETPGKLTSGMYSYDGDVEVEVGFSSPSSIFLMEFPVLCVILPVCVFSICSDCPSFWIYYVRSIAFAPSQLT